MPFLPEKYTGFFAISKTPKSNGNWITRCFYEAGKWIFYFFSTGPLQLQGVHHDGGPTEQSVQDRRGLHHPVQVQGLHAQGQGLCARLPLLQGAQVQAEGQGSLQGPVRPVRHGGQRYRRRPPGRPDVSPVLLLFIPFLFPSFFFPISFDLAFSLFFFISSSLFQCSSLFFFLLYSLFFSVFFLPFQRDISKIFYLVSSFRT